MIRSGNIATGIQESTKGEVDVKAGGSTVAKVDASGVRSQQGIIRHKNTISTTIGATSAATAITIASTGIVTFVDDIVIKDGGTIGSASDTDAISIASDGKATLSQKPTFSQGIANTGTIDAGTLGSSVTVQAGSPIAVQLASSASSSATAQVDFNSSLITDSYRTYRLCFNLVIPASDETEPQVYFSQDNGSSFISSGINSRRQYHNMGVASSQGGELLSNAGYADFGTDLGYDANEGFGGYMDIFGIRQTNSTYFFCEATCVGKHAADAYWWTTGIRGYKGNSTAINFLRFRMNSGNLAVHDVSLWGFK